MRAGELSEPIGSHASHGSHDVLMLRLQAVSLFLENWGENAKRGSVTVTVTALPLVARASEDERKELARLPTPTLLAARSIAVPMLTCLAFFPTDFRGKERLLAVCLMLRGLSYLHNWVFFVGNHYRTAGNH